MPILALLVATTASAHVSVKPGEAGVGSFQTFTISVPNERDIPTVGVRLIIPEGLEHVSPTVKPGWNVRIVEAGAGAGNDHEAGVVTELIWTGGSIPAHFRDEFTFSAKVPGQASTLLWKAYQTYQGNNIVSWELAPGQEQPKKADGTSDFSQFGPASQTKIIDDLSAQPKVSDTDKKIRVAVNKSMDAMMVGALAVVLSVLSIYFAKRK